MVPFLGEVPVVQPETTHFERVLERRSREDLEALLAERLAEVREGVASDMRETLAVAA
jgi:hypothetical protein